VALQQSELRAWKTSQSNFARYFFTQFPNKNIGTARWKPDAGKKAHDIHTFVFFLMFEFKNSK